MISDPFVCPRCGNGLTYSPVFKTIKEYLVIVDLLRCPDCQENWDFYTIWHAYTETEDFKKRLLTNSK